SSAARATLSRRAPDSSLAVTVCRSSRRYRRACWWCSTMAGACSSHLQEWAMQQQEAISSAADPASAKPQQPQPQQPQHPKVRMHQDNVLVELVEPMEDRSSGGIILPATRSRNPEDLVPARVIATGPGHRLRDGRG